MRAGNYKDIKVNNDMAVYGNSSFPPTEKGVKEALLELGYNCVGNISWSYSDFHYCFHWKCEKVESVKKIEE